MKRGGIVVIVAVFGAGLLSVVLNVGYWLSAPQSIPTRGDLIVALGGGTGGRIQTALQLYRNGWAEKILLTGFSRGTASAIQPAQKWEAKYLLAGGVPSDALLFDDRSRNSYEEAQNTVLLMKSRQWERALVVSDPPHLRRLDMVWRPACAKLGLEYRLIATESPTWNASLWWHDKVWAKFVGMELLKLSYYAVVY